jgi:hypothetical protein
MKNRLGQYVLLILTVIVWSGIAYKIYKQTSSKDDLIKRENIETPVSKETTVSDTFNIINNYANPFIEVVGNELLSVEENNNQEQIIDFEPPKIDWPTVKFFGSITNHNKKDQLFLINITNNDYLMKNKDEIKGVKIIKVFKDSIILTYKNEIKTFHKQLKISGYPFFQ